MGIIAHNTTQVPLALKDYYIWDAAFNSGYYGALEYLIPARRQKLLSCSIFTRKLMEEKKPQEIHVRIGEETRLVLHREDFENNREVVFEIGNDGVLIARFTRRGETSFADRIWALIPFCGAGDNMEASVARMV